MHEYSADSIFIMNWPACHQTPDKKWRRIWSIELEQAPTDATLLRRAEQALSNDEVSVQITNVDKSLTMKVVTGRWCLEDDLIGYAWDILEGVNDIVGKIDTIQGQERDRWSPWQRRQKQQAEKPRE